MDQSLNKASDYVVHTFGCKVNTYDTGLIQKNMSQNGFNLLNKSNQKVDSDKTQIHILNTCAVTAEATQEAVKAIRRIKAKQPFSTIVVTGCSAQVDTGYFENLPGADIVVANSHKGMIPDLLDKHFKKELTQKVFKSNIFKKDDLEIGGGKEQSHTRNFLKIQDGCNSFCTFCIIPYARGKSRSISIAEIVSRVKEFTAQGINEVVLTGVHIGDYEDVINTISGKQKKHLEDLVEAVLEKTTIPRIRLSSLEPIEVSERLLALYKNDRLCPHFHMSIQSANTEVLKQMKRKYSQMEVVNSLNQINHLIPNSFVGMDVIAGFPSETDEQFEDTYKTLSETPWTRLHVFPYSERQGTKAVELEQIPFHRRKERAARLRELSQHRYQSEMKKMMNTNHLALTLKNEKDINGVKYVESLTRNYWTVYLPKSEMLNANQEYAINVNEIKYAEDDVYLIGGLIGT